MESDSIQKQSAEIYSQMSSFQQEVGEKLISKLSIHKGAKILDLGCGTGETTVCLSQLVGSEGKIVALDPDADRILFAKKTNARANIEFLVGNDETFPEDQYDVVFMNCVIHWVIDKKALYNRVDKNLKPGGTFAFSTNNGRNEVLPITRKLFTSIIPSFFDIYWKKSHSVGVDEYMELQKSTSFVSVVSEIEHMKVYCENTEACLRYYFGVMQGQIDLSSVDQEALRAFKWSYDEEVRNNPMPRQVLFVVLIKTRS